MAEGHRDTVKKFTQPDDLTEKVDELQDAVGVENILTVKK